MLLWLVFRAVPRIEGPEPLLQCAHLFYASGYLVTGISKWFPRVIRLSVNPFRFSTYSSTFNTHFSAI